MDIVCHQTAYDNDDKNTLTISHYGLVWFTVPCSSIHPRLFQSCSHTVNTTPTHVACLPNSSTCIQHTSCAHVCVHTLLCAWVCVHTLSCAWVCVRVCVCVCVYMYMRVSVCACVSVFSPCTVSTAQAWRCTLGLPA